MIRFLFRLASLVALVVAVAAGTMDSIESVSSSEVVLTSLSTAWTELDGDRYLLLEDAARTHLPSWLWATIHNWVLPQPAFAAFLLLSLLFWMIGYKKPNPAGRFAA